MHNLRKRVEASQLVEPPVTIEFSSDRTVAVLHVPIVGNGTDDRSYRGARRAAR
jgi:hypothetical protein